MNEPQPKLHKSNPLSSKLSNILNSVMTLNSLGSPCTTPLFNLPWEHYLISILLSQIHNKCYQLIWIENSSSWTRNTWIPSICYEMYARVTFSDLQDLATIESDIESIQSTCAKMDNKLQKAFSQTDNIIQQTRNLKSKKYAICTLTQIRNNCAIKQKLLETFLKEFTLSENQVKILTDPMQPVNHVFFGALIHLQNVNQQTREHMVTENHRAGYALYIALNFPVPISCKSLISATNPPLTNCTNGLNLKSLPCALIRPKSQQN